jgi:hypothetical protein
MSHLLEMIKAQTMHDKDLIKKPIALYKELVDY